MKKHYVLDHEPAEKIAADFIRRLNGTDSPMGTVSMLAMEYDAGFPEKLRVRYDDGCFAITQTWAGGESARLVSPSKTGSPRLLKLCLELEVLKTVREAAGSSGLAAHPWRYANGFEFPVTGGTVVVTPSEHGITAKFEPEKAGGCSPLVKMSVPDTGRDAEMTVWTGHAPVHSVKLGWKAEGFPAARWTALTAEDDSAVRPVRGGRIRVFASDCENGCANGVIIEMIPDEYSPSHPMAMLCSPHGDMPPEVVAWAAGKDGKYRLRIYSPERDDPKGGGRP